LRDALPACFPRTGLRSCVTIIDRPPRNARSAGAREAPAWRLAMGTSSKRALRGEVRTAVAASRRRYPALVLRPVFLANKIKHNLVLSWRSHSAIVRGLCIVRQSVIVTRASIGTDLSPRKRVFYREARSCRGIAAMASCSRFVAGSFFSVFSVCRNPLGENAQ